MIGDYLKNGNFSKRSVLAAALLPIAAVAIYNWFVSPQLQYLKAAQKYQETADKIERTSKTISSMLKTGRLRLDKISQQFEQKKQEFFDADAARAFLGGIQSDAGKNQCLVDTLKFLPEKIIAGSGSIEVRQQQAVLTVTGQYPNIVKLLDSLQNRKQKVWIDSIELELKDRMSGLLVCNLSLNIYTLKEKEMVSDVNAEK